MYIKIRTTYYKKKKYEYVCIVESETRYGCWRLERVLGTLGTVHKVRCHLDTLIAGLKKLRNR